MRRNIIAFDLRGFVAIFKPYFFSAMLKIIGKTGFVPDANRDCKTKTSTVCVIFLALNNSQITN